MFFYKAVLNGSCMGQDIRNILYYRSGPGVDFGGNIWMGADNLANAIYDTIWPSMKPIMPNDYTLDTIDIYPHNDLFSVLYQMPYSLRVAESGTGQLVHAGMGICMNFRFVVEPTGIVNGIKPPKYGYIALGPIPAQWVQEDGYIAETILDGTDVMALANGLGNDIADGLMTFWPIRVHHVQGEGPVARAFDSFADVMSCIPQKRASFRRSRMPER